MPKDRHAVKVRHFERSRVAAKPFDADKNLGDAHRFPCLPGISACAWGPCLLHAAPSHIDLSHLPCPRGQGLKRVLRISRQALVEG